MTQPLYVVQLFNMSQKDETKTLHTYRKPCRNSGEEKQRNRTQRIRNLQKCDPQPHRGLIRMSKYLDIAREEHQKIQERQEQAENPETKDGDAVKA